MAKAYADNPGENTEPIATVLFSQCGKSNNQYILIANCNIYYITLQKQVVSFTAYSAGDGIYCQINGVEFHEMMSRVLNRQIDTEGKYHAEPVYWSTVTTIPDQ